MIYCNLDFWTEILPIVEFVLEEEIGDEEAVRLIQQSGGGGSSGDGDGSTKENRGDEDGHWRQTESGDAQALTLDSSPTHSQNNDDPFTANLMNFYVSKLDLLPSLVPQSAHCTSVVL